MSADLIADVGAADANAYADVDFADDYFANRLNASAFTGASADNKAKALIDGARELSAIESRLQGYRTDSTQALAFPRRLVINRKAPIDATIGITGYPEFDDDIVPVDWKYANCELALEFLKAGSVDLAALPATTGVKRKVVGPIETEYESSSYRPMGLARFPRVAALVEQFLSTTAGGGLELVRC